MRVDEWLDSLSPLERVALVAWLIACGIPLAIGYNAICLATRVWRRLTRRA